MTDILEDHLQTTWMYQVKGNIPWTFFDNFNRLDGILPAPFSNQSNDNRNVKSSWILSLNKSLN